MTDKPDFETFRDNALTQVEFVGASLPPKDDWVPILLIDAPAGFCMLPLVDPATGEEILMGQEGLPEIVAALLQMEARLVARVQMGWSLNEDQAADGLRPADHPDRKEVLFVQVAEAGRQELWITDIDRSGDHPRIVEWKKSQANAGPFTEALQLAMDQAGRNN